jgi:choline-glycine betaine transporter
MILMAIIFCGLWFLSIDQCAIPQHIEGGFCAAETMNEPTSKSIQAEPAVLIEKFSIIIVAFFVLIFFINAPNVLTHVINPLLIRFGPYQKRFLPMMPTHDF